MKASGWQSVSCTIVLPVDVVSRPSMTAVNNKNRCVSRIWIGGGPNSNWNNFLYFTTHVSIHQCIQRYTIPFARWSKYSFLSWSQQSINSSLRFLSRNLFFSALATLQCFPSSCFCTIFLMISEGGSLMDWGAMRLRTLLLLLSSCPGELSSWDGLDTQCLLHPDSMYLCFLVRLLTEINGVAEH